MLTKINTVLLLDLVFFLKRQVKFESYFDMTCTVYSRQGHPSFQESAYTDVYCIYHGHMDDL